MKTFGKILGWIVLLFTPYVSFFEWKVDRFFTHVRSTDRLSDIKEELLFLMRKNLIVVNIWMEKKFKGYQYLSKGKRRAMYENAQKISEKFLKFCEASKIDEIFVRAEIKENDLTYPEGGTEKIVFLRKIADFLQPENLYHYIETSSFGKLLNDPEKEKLEGDCNQIVTLYVYLFSLKYDINELNIKLLPEHVCLHFRNIDVEATNGTFTRYRESVDVLPVTEIIATNMLDIPDYREEAVVISPRTMVKSAQLAYATSSLRSLVEKNLNIAYENLGNSAYSAGDFTAAIFYFEKAGNNEMLKACYGKEYNSLVDKVSSVKTVEQAKVFKSTYQRMLFLAQKMGDSKLEEWARKMLGGM
ncbi:MAG: hypothetical protein WC651_03710 [Candidatus Gracilibacteria bacterium]|jgi:hypothetical protein